MTVRMEVAVRLSWSLATASLPAFVGITFGRDKDFTASTKAVT
jgi:hypothetical protein